MSFKVNTEKFVFEKFINKVPISKIITDQLDKCRHSKVLLCPFNGLEEQDEGIVVKNSSCKNCGLCDLKYSLLSNSLDSYQAEESVDEILGSIPHVSILAKMLFPETSCVAEVIADGNSRNKRIDLVLKDDKNLFLFKILTSSSKLNFYSRSYEEVKESISKTCKGTNIYVIFLIAENVKNDSKEINNFCFVTLKEIIEMGKTYGHFIK